LVNGMLWSDLIAHLIRDEMDFKSQARSDEEGRVTRIRDPPRLSFRRMRLTGNFVREDRVKEKVPNPLEKLPGRSPIDPRGGSREGSREDFVLGDRRPKNFLKD
jgi:hypothetical protein